MPVAMADKDESGRRTRSIANDSNSQALDQPTIASTNAAGGSTSEINYRTKFSLSELASCNNTICHERFMDNLKHIFQYCMKDILEMLNDLDMEVLNNMHKTLAESVP